MLLNGTHTLNASPDIIWGKLMNTEILAKIVPGISKLVKLADNEFEAISEIKLGPVSGKFSGGLTLTEIQEPSTFTLNVTQNSKIGNAIIIVTAKQSFAVFQIVGITLSKSRCPMTLLTKVLIDDANPQLGMDKNR